MTADPTPDEAELLDAWRAGHVQAGQTLFRRHYVGLTRSFRSKAGEAAHELTQATFLACVEGRGSICTAARFPAYLYAATRVVEACLARFGPPIERPTKSRPRLGCRRRRPLAM